MKDEPAIEIDIYADNAIPKPGGYRYMFVLFTLEHRAYSASDAKEIAEQMRADGAGDVYCVKVDCGEAEPDVWVPGWLME